ncbi:nucleoside 2-deoxyribosyltransferase [Aminobacter sp. DSM 101952]|uniref:nucleoside 2-deoxyribosyltransferase n=1 Tax=Aminobacter sp. DSM 101952 TaxID=2735891 RepID=UPI0006FBA1AA|nr:nucleoside 2-deoxyribosyltransferase [Aminobacter sp. DSM 101952]KQU75470.1 nucleoside 2-deoxyribosyltransferase [Aminobacter sp. DSM 101952]
MKIYLAGPEVFLSNAREVLDRKIDLTRRYGFVPVSPGDLEVPATDTKRAKGLAISSINERLMMSADMIIANLTPFRGVAADVGTAFELGFMCARGCPAYAFSNVLGDHYARVSCLHDGRIEPDAHGRPRGPDGLAVEDFDMVDNLMLDGGIEARGGMVITREVAPAELYTDHQAFEECLRQAAAKFLL